MGSEADEMGAQSHIEAGYRGDVQRLERELAEAKKKAKRYDQWFKPGRCWACHFEEKHLASCPVKAAEDQRDEAQAALAQAQGKGVLLYLHCQIDSHWRKWWVKTCEYWHEQADRSRENVEVYAASEGVWGVVNELERRLGEALDAQAPSREVVEQAQELAKVFKNDDDDEQDCRICGVVGHDHCIVTDFLAALAKLKEKPQRGT